MVILVCNYFTNYVSYFRTCVTWFSAVARLRNFIETLRHLFVFIFDENIACSVVRPCFVRSRSVGYPPFVPGHSKTHYRPPLLSIYSRPLEFSLTCPTLEQFRRGICLVMLWNYRTFFFSRPLSLSFLSEFLWARLSRFSIFSHISVAWHRNVMITAQARA